MENHNKLVSWLFSILVGIISFFLYMFYVKVDSISTAVQNITVNSAVKDEQLKSIEIRITHLEQAVSEYNNNNNNKTKKDTP